VAYLIEVPLEGGDRIVAEVEPELVDGELMLASAPGKIAAQARETLEKSLAQLGPALSGMLGTLRAARPAEMQVQFGIKLGGETGVVVAKGTAEVNFLVTMTWRQDSPARRRGPVTGPPRSVVHDPLGDAAERLDRLHVHAADGEAECEGSADSGVALGVLGPRRPSTVVSASYTCCGVAVSGRCDAGCQPSRFSSCRVRWIASAIRLMRCSRASQVDPTEASCAAARASWSSSTR
jgi:Trypsin-co-occurring domain 1